MRSHLQYARYIVRHKWYVFQECRKLGILWRGITHDLSKFRPDEWLPYLEFYYTDRARHEAMDAISEFGVAELAPFGYFVEDRYNLAWLRHIHRNPHHWQHFVLREDNGGVKCLPMPYDVICEMVADWRGAGKAQGFGDNTVQWYADNEAKMMLHPQTRELVDSLVYGHN